MSSDSSSPTNLPTKRLFAVYAPDYTDPAALDRRYSVREEHPPTTTPSFSRAEFGGALLAPELIDENDRNKITGSLAFYEAESIEEVRKVVESDIYYTSGVVRLVSLLCLQVAGRRIRQYKRPCGQGYNTTVIIVCSIPLIDLIYGTVSK